MIDVIKEEKDYLVVRKPSFLPTAPLKNLEGPSLVKDVAEYFPEIMNVHGRQEWEGGVLHRLDTPTSGLVLFARNQEFYNLIVKEQNNYDFVKEYRATASNICVKKDGFPELEYSDEEIFLDALVLDSAFRSYGPKGAQVRPVLKAKANGLPIYRTVINAENSIENTFICTLAKGFRHQVRVHMAWQGLPLLGDTLYGGEESDTFGLDAIAISFFDLKGKKIKITTKR